MSREDFVAVATRLFALYVLFLTVRSVPAATSALSQPDGAGWLWLYALMLGVFLALAAFLWFFPLTVARKLLPVMREPRSESALDASSAFSVGITLLGLWFFASAIGDALYWIALAVLVRQPQFADAMFQWTPDQIASMVSTGVQLALALVLLLGATGIKRLIYRLRYGDVKDAPSGATALDEHQP